jgi:hypothetical protein
MLNISDPVTLGKNIHYFARIAACWLMVINLSHNCGISGRFGDYADKLAALHLALEIS